MSSPPSSDDIPPGTPAPDADHTASEQSEDHASYRRIFEATSIVGGAQVISIAVGIARTKIFALLLGPAGIGLFGLLNALMSAASIVAQMGMGAVGTRQIAEAHASGDREKMALARRALMIATLFLSVVGGAIVWWLREPLARYALGDPALANAAGWMGVGVALSVAAIGQGALIQGMRRMGDLALLQIGAALLLTVVGLPLAWIFGDAAVPFYVVLSPLASFVLGHILVARLAPLPPVKPSLPELAAQWRMFLVFGLPMMGAAVIGSLAAFWIQAYIKAQLGLDALGFFVAANTIATQYAGLVLAAMGGDYFPRLSGVIDDHPAARRLVSQQTDVALLLAAPLIIGIFALAPWVVQVLYSSSFAPTAEVLRWMSAGTLLKVLTWPMGFILLAERAGRTFFLTELVTLLVMAVATSLLVDRFGLAGAGMAYFAAYVLYLPLMLVFAAPRIGLVWRDQVLRIVGVLAFLGLMVIAARWSEIAAAVIGVAGAGFLGVRGLVRIATVTQLGNARLERLARLGARVKAWMTRPS